MGLIDTIRGFFSPNSNNSNTMQSPVDEDRKKSFLADSILNSIDGIKKIDSFDSSIWNLANASKNSLKMKSLSELQQIDNTLKDRLTQLTEKRAQSNSRRDDSLEKAMWTGQKPAHLTDNEFNRLQNDDYMR